jgi:hypothetical protein
MKDNYALNCVRYAPSLLEVCKEAIAIIHCGTHKCPFGVPYTPLKNQCDCNYHEEYRKLLQVTENADRNGI